MEKVEKHSPDWVEGRRLYERTHLSARKIGKLIGASHTAVLNRAEADGWKRLPKGKLETSLENPVEAQARALADADPRTLTRHGRVIIQRLMAELEAATLHGDELQALIEEDFAGPSNARRRAKLEKLLSFESKAKTANYLATALAKLNDALPGKKEQARTDAETAGQNSELWGDLDGGGPKLVN